MNEPQWSYAPNHRRIRQTHAQHHRPARNPQGNKGELKGFYGVLKSCDRHLKLVFLTGVTKFSHVSVFSDLNHLSDLTLDSRYADICGITQEELETGFAPEIDAVLEKTGNHFSPVIHWRRLCKRDI